MEINKRRLGMVPKSAEPLNSERCLHEIARPIIFAAEKNV